MRHIFIHQQNIIRSLDDLSDVQISLFLCAVCQRQVKVYEVFVENALWANVSELNQIMNYCWLRSVFLGEKTVLSVPEMSNFLDTTSNQSSSTYAIDAFSSIWFLTQWLLSFDRINIASPIENAFNILDGHIYDLEGYASPSAEADALVDQHLLVMQEIERQETQLRIVKNLGSAKDELEEFHMLVSKQTLLNT